MILMSTLLVCSLESFAQSDAEVTDSLWKDVDLNAVTVVASKPLVKMETDKMTYNVQQDADAKASTVLDMLRKVPMVTVDGQDNITVNGSSSFKVYVDGKPNPMFSANPSQIFKAMPATMVKNIEVITNPGAKYDAEGTGGVLNIVLNKQAVNGGGGSVLSNGYNGNISAAAGNQTQRISAFISGQQGKLTYSANGMYNHQRMDGTTISFDRIQKDGSTMNYYQNSDMKQPFSMGNISLSYELDSLSNISATAGLTTFNQKITGHPLTKMAGGIYGEGFEYGKDEAGYGQHLLQRKSRLSAILQQGAHELSHPQLSLQYQPFSHRRLYILRQYQSCDDSPAQRPALEEQDTRNGTYIPGRLHPFAQRHPAPELRSQVYCPHQQERFPILRRSS